MKWVPGMMVTVALVVLCVLAEGCASIERAWEWGSQYKIDIEKRDDDAPGETGGGDGATDAAWRSDLADIPAVNGVLQFRTRNIGKPPGPNRDGGSEWIICRVHGEGIRRVLIMSMETNGNARPPSRIFYELHGVEGHMDNNVFPVPLIGEHLWELEANGNDFVIRLDGEEIWRKRGTFTVNGGVMQGYPNRGFIGEWSQ